MKNTTTCAKKLTSLLKKLPTPEPQELPGSDNPVGVLVLSFMMWEANTTKAITAHNRLLESVVDYNDLRVCMSNEAEEVIGVRYPRALERCQRLRAALKDLYNREHSVCLDRLADLGKRDIKAYVESLDGMVPFVASRVLLLSFDGHAVPVDDQLRQRLVDESAADESADVAELSAWLARRIKASEARAAHEAFQAWIDSGPARPARGKKKTTKKTSSTRRSTSRKPAKSSGRSTRKVSKAAG